MRRVCDSRSSATTSTRLPSTTSASWTEKCPTPWTWINTRICCPVSSPRRWTDSTGALKTGTRVLFFGQRVFGFSEGYRGFPFNCKDIFNSFKTTTTLLSNHFQEIHNSGNSPNSIFLLTVLRPFSNSRDRLQLLRIKLSWSGMVNFYSPFCNCPNIKLHIIMSTQSLC